jgi:imidazolonepropionase-like amidohydrolase
MIDNMRQLGDIPLAELLTWATLNGARALGIDDRMGEIAVGKRPGLVIIEGADLSSLRLTEQSCARRLV